MALTKKNNKKRTIADAALDALFDTSSDDEEEDRDDDSSSSKSSSDSSDDDAPILPKKKKKKSSTTKDNTISSSEGNNTKYSKQHLKPQFQSGDKVYSAWWDNTSRKGDTSWHPGTISSYREVPTTNSPYGPMRYYNIKFDDGDEFDDVEDYYVFPEVDYKILEKNDFKTDNCIGVENVHDDNVRGVEGKWPRIVGWYVTTTCDGKKSEYARLSDAMDAYDNYIMQTKGKQTKRSDLNRPKKWPWLFSDETDDNIKEKAKSKKKKKGKEKKKGKKEKKSKSPTPTLNVASPIKGQTVPSSDKGDDLDGDSSDDSDEGDSHRHLLKSNTSGYIGVSYLNDLKSPWKARIKYKGKHSHLGYFALKTNAALAYDEALKSLKGPNTTTNFANLEEYERAKKKELAETGLSNDVSMSSVAIAAKVSDIVRKNWPEDSRDAEEQQSRPSKKGNSRFVGVSYNTQKKKWKSQIAHDGKDCYLMRYVLEADAALAFDEAVKLLRGPDANTNFSSFEDYEEAKKRELNKKGLNDDIGMSSTEIKSTVYDMVKKKWPNLIVSKTKPITQTQPKQSDYTGVTYNKIARSFMARIGHGGKLHHVGNWKLQSDAALAYDEACKLLNGEDCSKVNFGSDQAYMDTRSKELGTLSSAASIEPISSVLSKIRTYLSKIPCPELEAINNAMAAKWSRYLPSDNGNNFLESYQQSMGELLGMTIRQNEAGASSPTVVSGNADGGAEDMDVEESNPDAYFKPIRLEGSPPRTLNDVVEEEEPGTAKVVPPVVTSDPLVSFKKALSMPSSIDDVIRLMDTLQPNCQYYNRQKDGRGGCAKMRGKLRKYAQANDDQLGVKHWIETGDWVPPNNKALSALMIIIRDMIDKSWPAQPEKETDDDDSLFGDSDTEAEADDDVVMGTTEAATARTSDIKETSANNTNTPTAESNQKEPDIIKEFPIGCPVMWNFDDNSFHCGTVASLPINNGTEYGIMSTTATPNGEKERSTRVQGKLLAFGLDCPVHVVPAPTGGDTSTLLEGKVLLCSIDGSYTILITTDGNQFQLMKGIPEERVKYRKVAGTEPSSAALPKSNTEPVGDDDDNMIQKEPRKKQLVWEPPISKRNKPAEDNRSQESSQQFFSSNSTITSQDSARASSRRLSGGTPRTAGDSEVVDCCLYIPRWLIPDNMSKKRLFSSLTDESCTTNFQKIGRKANCSLRFIDGSDPHVLIEAKPGKYATDDIRNAANGVEKALLEYIRFDGSRGRLFYDLARRCTFLHPRGGGAESTAVMQRNPFSQSMEMGWINIVELPYELKGGGKKNYHGHFLLGKKSGVLGKIKSEIGYCELKICGDAFRVPMKFCNPYIWIMGKQPGQVDRAVEVLQEEIQKYMRERLRLRL